MKTKLSKILGVSLAVILVFGLAFALMPTKQAEAQAWTANQWTAMNIPGANNAIRLAADCNFIAIGGDGATFYVVDNQANALYKSINGGLTWVNVTPAAPAFTFNLRGIAVAPDDPNVVAVADGGAAPGVVYISTNGAATWSTLPALGTFAGFVATSTIQSIAVSPATLSGREYMVCTAALNNNAGDGNVFIFGTAVAPLAWSEYGATGGGDPLVPGQDFTSCAFSPNYGNDSTILVVGSDNVNATDNTYLNIKNTGFAGWNAAAAQGFVGWPVAFNTASSDSPGESAIVASGIALPSDFDPTNANWRRVYAYYDAAANVPDAYRFDDFTCRQLNVNSGNAIRLASISYAGTYAAGTLFAGDRAGAYTAGSQVRRCADPWVALPTWYLTPKAPTGNTVGGVANTRVVADPNFLTNGIVYAGTSGAAANDQSAFSRSTNGGVSFNQISLIDANIASVQDVAPAADGATFFMATAGADASGGYSDSLWRTTSTPPPLGFLWERVFTDNFTNSGLIRLDPEYVDTNVVYFAEIAALGSNKLKYSADGGEIWSNRFTPAVVTDLAVADSNTLYALIGTTTRKSTNSGWGGSWGLPKNTGLAAARTVLVAPNGDVLVGGLGDISLSTDGGDTYNALTGAIGAAGGLIQVAVDKDYATNGTVYAASSTANEGIWRWVIGTDTAWENILAPASWMTGLVQWNGYLYGSENVTAGGSAVERIMAPTLQVTDMLNTWTTLDRPVATVGGTALFNRAPSALKACDNGSGGTLLFAINTAAATSVLAYNDTMAHAAITVSVNPDPVTADPATGRNNDFTVSWNQVSNATAYLLYIWNSPTGFDVAYGPIAVAPAAAGVPSQLVPTGNLPSGRSYWVSVMATQQAPGDGNLSPWSDRLEFTVEYSSPIQAPYAGPVLLGPTPGATDVSPNVGFSWGPILGATEYEFILAKNATLTDVVFSETVTQTAYGPVTLDYATDYWYAVRATAPNVSPQSIGSFTTLAESATKAAATPLYIWIVIAIGAILVIAVIWLIFSTRRA